MYIKIHWSPEAQNRTYGPNPDKGVKLHLHENLSREKLGCEFNLRPNLPTWRSAFSVCGYRILPPGVDVCWKNVDSSRVSPSTINCKLISDATISQTLERIISIWVRFLASNNFYLRDNVQEDSGDHLVNHPMGVGINSSEIKLTTHHLVTILRIRGVIPPLPYISAWPGA